MESKWTDRTALLLGEDKMLRIRDAHVLVVGVGGVGAYAAEMLCRAGVGELTIVDADTVNVTNINRQLPATHSTIGRLKTEILAQRLRDINPAIRLHEMPIYLKEEEVTSLLDGTLHCQLSIVNCQFNFIVDAIDTIAPKCALIGEALRRGIPIVSSMGAGAKSDITQIRFADLWDTYHCKKEGLRRPLPVVFSTEQANRNAVITVEGEQNKKSTAGTISYMPAVFGCYLAEYVIRKL